MRALKRGLAFLLLLSLPLLAMGPAPHRFRFQWGWGDVIVFAVASMALVWGALMVNYVLLGAAIATLLIAAALNYYRAPEWSRALLAALLVALALYLITA